MRINIEKIERERLHLGINKAKFASKVGISRQLYYEFLNTGSTKLSTLEKIAKSLDIDTKDFLISDH